MAEKRKRRLGCFVKTVAAVIALLVVVFVAGPLVAAPYVRGAIETAIEERTGGEATIGALSFSLFGSASVGEIDVRDAAGQPLATVDEAEASFSLLDVVAGRLAVNATARGVVAHVRLDEAGAWNFEDLVEAGSGAEADEEEDPASSLPDVAARIAVTDLRLVVHGPAGETSLAGDIDLNLADLALPAPLSCEVALTGPDGEAGTVRITGELTLAADGRAAGLEPTGHVEVAVDALDLAAFEHLAVHLAPVTELGGVADGSIAVHVDRQLAVRADTDLTVRDVLYQGTRPDERLAVAEVRVTGTSTTAEDGGFAQRLDVSADDFLTCVLDGTWTPTDDGGAGIAGSARIDGDVAGLAGALHAWLPLQEGMTPAGRFTTKAELSGTLAGEELRTVASTIDVRCDALEVRDADGQALPLDELTSLAFTTGADLDFETGRLSLADLTLVAGPVNATGTVEVQGLLAAAATEMKIEDSTFEVEADLDQLRTILGRFVDLEAVPFGGRLDAKLTARGGAEKTRLVGKVKTDDLVFGEAEDGTPRDYGELTCTLDAWYFFAPDRLKLTVCEVVGDPLTANVQGKVFGLAAGAPELDLTVEAASDLARAQRAFPLPADVPVRDATGNAQVALALRGSLEEMQVEGTVTMIDLAFGVVTEATGDAPWPIVEPNVVAELKATLAPDPGDVTLERFHLDAQAMRADVTGRLRNVAPLAPAADVAPGIVLEDVRGEAFYVPDRVGALLDPWLPGTLSGADEERLSFTLNGRASEIDPLTLLAGTNGTAELGLGRFVTGGFDTGGTVQLRLGGEKASWDGALTANGGTLALQGEVDLRASSPAGEPPPRSTLQVELQDVGANSKLSPLMGLVHPAFSAVNALEKSEVGGLIDCRLDLAYDGAVTPEMIDGGWEALPKGNISGTGSFSLESASLQGSPLFRTMLSELGMDPERTLDLPPVEFSIEAGRVTYAEPWSWTIGETKTTFTGSIGLDETLALTWDVPIDDALVGKYDFLDPLRGQSIAVPLGGTIRSPKLEWQGMLRDLAQNQLRDLAEDKLRDLLRGGGSDDEGEGAAANDPAALLAEADRLWRAGSKVEAAALYKQIREQHKVSLVYALNRDRIKERAAYRED